MQAQATVTDRLSMAFAIRNLSPIGWKPGVHLSLPQELRPYHMTEFMDARFAKTAKGRDFDFATEWVGLDVPLAVDRDK